MFCKDYFLGSLWPSIRRNLMPLSFSLFVILNEMIFAWIHYFIKRLKNGTLWSHHFFLFIRWNSWRGRFPWQLLGCPGYSLHRKARLITWFVFLFFFFPLVFWVSFFLFSSSLKWLLGVELYPTAQKICSSSNPPNLIMWAVLKIKWKSGYSFCPLLMPMSEAFSISFIL